MYSNSMKNQKINNIVLTIMSKKYNQSLMKQIVSQFAKNKNKTKISTLLKISRTTVTKYLQLNTQYQLRENLTEFIYSNYLDFENYLKNTNNDSIIQKLNQHIYSEYDKLEYIDEQDELNRKKQHINEIDYERDMILSEIKEIREMFHIDEYSNRLKEINERIKEILKTYK